MDLNTHILNAAVEFFARPFASPLLLSTGAIRDVPEARVRVVVRVAGREAEGRGNILLSDLWAWPDPAVPHEARVAAMRALCCDLAARLAALCGGEPAHPLVLGLRLHRALHADPPAVPAMPLLARAVCASPLDAAIHDAVGQALGRSAFDFYGPDVSLPEADEDVPGGALPEAVRNLIEHKPLTRLAAWWIVGAHDDLEAMVKPAVKRHGFRCFKLKLPARDPAADAARTAEVFRAVRAFGATRVRLSADTNEANPDADSVRVYLEQLRADAPDAFRALEYLEQPTPRDILRHAFDWRPVTRLKPVLLDEGLTGFDRLPLALEQGWSGLALKTCKGHSFALAAAAWARRQGMMLTLQDLTNPGYSAIHAALFASRVRTVNGVELNSPQFIPQANAEWLPRLQALFYPTDGFHVPASPRCAGLGSRS
jgi:L-alanine-DL-glutamate epimerase-like enolase superfamily enzyme